LFKDRKVVPKHLPLAKTQSDPEDETAFFSELEQLFYRFSV
jgi:hypothetical protein